ncbi:MAG: IS4 family transposase [Candidatus Competibacteraceae bacterium]|nr:IS4 family transposase [Candidatus Competibacteraceae bacterium]
MAVSWAAAELGGANLGDTRLNRRLVRVAERLGAQPVARIPVACGGWAETQAAYRLLANAAVDWEGVLAPHWDCSVERMRRQPVVLCVQDTTELDFTAQPGIAGLGPLSYLRQHGLYVHPTLAVTPDGVPLGVLDAWLWARDRETFGEDRRHWPIEAKESMRGLEGFERCAEWAETLPDTRRVYVADRECDIHEFMVRAQRGPGIDGLIRATHNRCLEEGDKLWDRLAPVLGEVTFTLPARPNRPSRPVVLTVRAERVTLHPKGGEPVTVTALRAREESPPVGIEPLDGRLLSNRPADTLARAAEWLQWYGSRWSIEVFFRIFKTGCRVEALPLSTLERLEPALALYLIIAWRIQYLTLLGRTPPDLPCDAVLDPDEWQAVYVAIHHQPPPLEPPPLPVMLRWIARLGGYLGRKHDGPPGPKALWIGLQRARDLAWGMRLASELHFQSTG